MNWFQRNELGCWPLYHWLWCTRLRRFRYRHIDCSEHGWQRLVIANKWCGGMECIKCLEDE